MHLTRGAVYSAEIHLSGLEAMLANDAAVKGRLEGLGFADVTVTNQGGGHFRVTGRWNRADGDVPIPSMVANVVQVPAPAPVATEKPAPALPAAAPAPAAPAPSAQAKAQPPPAKHAPEPKALALNEHPHAPVAAWLLWKLLAS